MVAERGYQITYETPRSEHVKLFHLGERTYDHLVFLPAKVKGKFSAFFFPLSSWRGIEFVKMINCADNSQPSALT